METKEIDHYTTIQGVRESTKAKLDELKEELELTWNGILVHLMENQAGK